MYNNVIKNIGSILKRNKKFLIASHKDPDGDALGSSLALYNTLLEMEKEVYVMNLTPFDHLQDSYSFLGNFDKIESEHNKRDVEIIITVDTADLKRSGLSREYVKNKLLVNIDHHNTNTKFGDINLVIPEASAVGCILFDIFKMSNILISKQTAICLYTSILTDTGSFRYESTTPKAFLIASELLELGVNPWFVAYNIYESKRLKSLKLLGLTLSTIETFYNKRLSLMYITNEMYKITKTQAEDTESFVNFARSIKGCDVGILLREDKPHYFKISIRSKGNIDVSKIALGFGGGGHPNAAGFEVEGEFEDIKSKVIQAFSFL